MIPIPDVGELLDGCELDFADDAVDDDTVEYLPLFPDGIPDAAKAATWRELFGAT